MKDKNPHDCREAWGDDDYYYWNPEEVGERPAPRPLWQRVVYLSLSMAACASAGWAVGYALGAYLTP